jgi:hypothetical protein
MIKKIKNFICKLIGIKQCACPEDMDEHSELYLKTPEHCSSHLRFRKSCKACQEIVA